MANLGGTAVDIPQPGEHFNNSLYVARCILGYGSTTYDGSDGYDRWTDTQETVPLFNINATDIIVHQVYRDVETAFTASVTISIGDGANTSGFIDAASLAATLASSGLVGDDTTSNRVYDGGKWYKATDAIDAVVGGANPAVGKMSVYVVYSHAPSLPLPDTGGSSNT